MDKTASANTIKATLAGIMTLEPDKVAQARANPKLRGWFVGRTMIAIVGKVDVRMVDDIVNAVFDSPAP